MKKYFNEMLAIILFIITGYILYIIGYINYEGEPCIVDGIRNITSPSNVSKIIALFEIYYLYVTKDDFRIMNIIMRKSRRELWKKQFRNSIIISLLLCTYVFVITTIISAYYYGEGGLTNWNMYYSVYAIQSRGCISDISIVAIYLKAWILILAQTIVCYVFSQLIIWITDIRALPLVIIIAAAISDIHVTYVAIFFSRFNYAINQWGDISIGSINVVIKLVLGCLLIYASGYYFSEHKEFIGEKDANV